MQHLSDKYGAGLNVGWWYGIFAVAGLTLILYGSVIAYGRIRLRTSSHTTADDHHSLWNRETPLTCDPKVGDKHPIEADVRRRMCTAVTSGNASTIQSAALQYCNLKFRMW